MEHSIFLCHSSEDKPLVKMIAEKLKKESIKVWIDEAEILPGDSIITKIKEGIDKTRFFLAFISENSIKSNWVKYELENALTGEINRKTLVIPAILGECKIPSLLENKHYANFSELDNIDNEISRVVKKIKTHQFASIEKTSDKQKTNNDEYSMGDAVLDAAKGLVGVAQAYQALKDVFSKSDTEKSKKYYNKGNENYANLHIEDAIKNLDKAIQYDDNNYNAHNLLAWILASYKMQLPTALAHAKKALSLKPNSDYIYDTLSEVYYADGKYDKVLEVYNQTIKDCEILNDNVKYTFNHRIGRCLLNMGDEYTDKAIEWFNAALNIGVNDRVWDLAGLYYSLSICYIRKKDKKTALLLIDSAIKMRKNEHFVETRKQILSM